MSYRLQIDNCDEIGCFMMLTNTYCLVTDGVDIPLMASQLDVPVIQCQVDNGNPMVGTMTCGNSQGLLIPTTTTD
jgi:translation initiation factor 6 (eIF-6)